MAERMGSKEKIDIGKCIVALIGPEGSGKTVIAKHLAEISGKEYISTGDILRNLAANDPGELGERCKKMFAVNEYLPGETFLQVLATRFGNPDTQQGFVLDGGFRTLEEIQGFPKMLEAVGRNHLPLIVIFLQIPEEVSFARLLENRKRTDDTPEGIKRRLGEFNFQLPERIEAIKKECGGTLILIDATAPVEEVFARVCGALRVWVPPFTPQKVSP